jgi:hypothetical protein
MLQALRSLMLPAQFEAGFLGCQLYAEAGEADSLCYLEQWVTQCDLEREIRSIRFGRLLAVMETAAGLPTLEVRHVSETRSWDYIQEIRGGPGSASNRDVN